MSKPFIITIFALTIVTVGILSYLYAPTTPSPDPSLTPPPVTTGEYTHQPLAGYLYVQSSESSTSTVISQLDLTTEVVSEVDRGPYVSWARTDSTVGVQTLWHSDTNTILLASQSDEAEPLLTLPGTDHRLITTPESTVFAILSPTGLTIYNQAGEAQGSVANVQDALWLNATTMLLSRADGIFAYTPATDTEPQLVHQAPTPLQNTKLALTNSGAFLALATPAAAEVIIYNLNQDTTPLSLEETNRITTPAPFTDLAFSPDTGHLSVLTPTGSQLTLTYLDTFTGTVINTTEYQVAGTNPQLLDWTLRDFAPESVGVEVLMD